jgi:DNA helicase-2/ATP-dependent DNA helicase PcrA
MELVKRGIPYVVYGGIKFSERKHIKDIISYLRILLNPTDAVAWHRILKLIEGVGEVTATKIIDEIRRNGGSFNFSYLTNKKFYSGIVKIEQTLSQANNPNISLPQKLVILKEYYTPFLQSIAADNYLFRMLDIDVLIDLSSKYLEFEKF